jgi:hypothetical protein
MGVKVVGRKERKDSKGRSQELHVQAAARQNCFVYSTPKHVSLQIPMQPWRHFHDLNTKSRVGHHFIKHRIDNID